jgi:hypothetical protein
MRTVTQYKAQVLPSAQDHPRVSNPSTQSVISFAFVGGSLAFAFLYLGGVGVITASAS